MFSKALQRRGHGMILSNEPGYYKTDQYGIRIENLVTEAPGGDGAEPHRCVLV
jgi:Xaa-Pro aminopeptidase